ncbi:Starch-binding associating with outer membrane [Pedobacter steynii]|uniref:Starch-binding associating with outer membrane n=1 Tax=Pedobacter steynii TaxID=430522 RepID=A0A1H0L374_9SPHI|nr:SusD/RagB family nutrient-binding outer membrane lipoprotein [Pedobacter steynii]NQX43402.1 SusD/RagB family nutrient-binding outer membrane lipoprotein [Pedobacter steynii]SDO62473.1 Starch-binding associating with outer membrane [Pedobacter steynii]
MKNIYKYGTMLVICLVVATGCRKHYEEINTDPSSYNPTNFNPNFLLTGAQLGYTGSSDLSYDTWRANLIYCGTMMQGISSVINYWAGDKYILNSGYTAAYWGFAASNINSGIGAYPEQVRLVVDLVAFTKDKPQYKNLHQISRIMKALIFQRITDLYGDVPYSQAGLGFLEKIYFPVYDKQQDIYIDMLKEVTAASDLLDAKGDISTGDAIFNGDIAKWKRFANSLVLRLAMRLSKVDPATAQSYVQKVIGKTMLSNDDNAFIQGDNNGGRTTLNRNSQILQGGGGKENFYTRWSSTFINFLKTNNDPRLGVIAVTNLYVNDESKTQNPGANADPAVQKGMPNGKDQSLIAGQGVRLDPSFTTYTDYSSPSPALIKGNGPTFILTYAETELLLADAAQRFGIAGSASQHYRAGVIAAMTYLSQYDAAATISVAAATAYADAHPYNSADGLNMINTQLWAHNNTKLDFYESWANWRRTGFPVLVPVVYPGNSTNGTIPRRFPYPVTEAGTNTENYNKAVASVPGGDLLTSRVWWDKN